MKCPKCGYHSFEHLESCKKCGQDLNDHKEKYNLRGFYIAGQAAPAAVAEPALEESPDTPASPAEDGSVDFGFDFLDEEADPIGETSATPAPAEEDRELSIDQPFDIDSETIPADDTPGEDGEDDDDKPGKGPEFAF